jgi:hypothetical protein
LEISVRIAGRGTEFDEGQKRENMSDRYITKASSRCLTASAALPLSGAADARR